MFGVIFDMDGVLLDTVPTTWRAWRDIMAERGVFIPDEDLPTYRGISFRDALGYWASTHGVSIGVDEFTSLVMREELKHGSREKFVSNDLLVFLEDLKAHHVPVSIGTASVSHRAEQLLTLTDMKKYFPVIVTASDVVHHKPAPDIFLAAAKGLNMDPVSCIVIEDSSSGIEAAHRAGMKAIGLAEDENNRRALSKADLLIGRFSELSYEKVANLMR